VYEVVLSDDDDPVPTPESPHGIMLPTINTGNVLINLDNSEDASAIVGAGVQANPVANIKSEQEVTEEQRYS
jgi:hypothetical protein